ncbi:MAG: hypothetical protein H7Z37_07730 [Pyrinomonadaceae bacterium]|nr:hypothetical protein [Pyrinomonadaceae bacterium]
MKSLKICAAIFSLSLTATTFAQTTKPTPTPTPKPTPNQTATANPAAALPKADVVIDKYIKALGGETAYRKITSRVVKGSVEVPAAGITGIFDGYQKAPNKSFLTVTIPNFGVIADGFDGANAWTSQPTTGLREKSGEELENIKRDSSFYNEIDFKADFAKRETVKITKVNDSDAYAVLLTPTTGAPQTQYFDTKTGLLVRKDEISVSPEGKMPVTTYYSDYRIVDGIQFPFLLRVEQPQIAVTLKTSEVKHNVEIDDAKFLKPQE